MIRIELCSLYQHRSGGRLSLPLRENFLEELAPGATFFEGDLDDATVAQACWQIEPVPARHQIVVLLDELSVQRDKENIWCDHGRRSAEPIYKIGIVAAHLQRVDFFDLRDAADRVVLKTHGN